MESCPDGDPGVPLNPGGAAGNGSSTGGGPSCPSTNKSSTIYNDTQVVGETIPLVGMPFTLNYSSQMVAGRSAHYQVLIPYTSASPSANLTGVTLTIYVAGQTITQSLTSPTASQSYLFTWNGLDNLGNPVVGPTMVQVNRTEIDSPATGNLPEQFYFTLGFYGIERLGLGGWGISIHHQYDPLRQTVYLGNGSNYNATASSYGTGGYEVASLDGTELYIFDSTGQHLQTLTALTGSTKYTFNYNGSNQLNTVVDAFGNTTTFNYTGGYLSSIVGPYGQTTTTTHDADGYLASVTNPNGEVYNMSYLGTGRLIYTFQTPTGITSTMTYDSSGNLLSDSSAAGSSVSLSSSASANTSTITTTLASGLLTTHKIQAASTAQYSRTDTSPASMVTNYYESPAMAGTNIADSTGYYYQASRTADARLGAMAYFTNSIYEVHYSYSNYPTFTQAVSLNSSNIFDINTLTTTMNLNGYNTTNTYTGATKKFTVTTPVGRTSYKVIDSYERPTSMQLASFTPFTYAYDTNGRLSTISQGTGRVTTLSYNSSGYLSSIQNPLTQTTSYAYDSSGRVTTQTLPDTRSISYSYDSNGNLSSVTPPGKSAHTLNHNGFDLLSSYITPTALYILGPQKKAEVEKIIGTSKSLLRRFEVKLAEFVGKISPKAEKKVVNLTGFTGFETDYAYNSDRKLTTITRPDASTISFTYDTNGILSGITIPTGSNTYSFSYGVLPLAFDSADGAAENFTYQGYLLTNDQLYFNTAYTRYATIAYTYGNNKNFQVASDDVTSNGTTSGTTINYTYDNDTLLTGAGSETITRSTSTSYVSTAKVGNLTETYSYTSDMGELSSILAKYNTTQDYSESVTRDALGRVSSRTEQYTSGTANTYGYTYDSAGRLTGVTLAGSTISSYSYDTNSNRTSQTLGSTTTTATYDGQDRVSTFGTRTYTFNSSGQLQSYSDSAYSPAHVTSFSYDALGNLKSVTPPSGSVIYYKVDAQNRRMEKLTGTTVDNYFMYDSKNRVIALLNSSGAITSRFIYGIHPNTPDYMVKSGTTYKIISNHLGSPVQVVASSSGTISEQIVYDEFGNITSDSSPGFQPFGFGGCLYDTDTKLCHFGARDYDAYTGRWTNRDPILFKGGDSNLYGYVMNDPVNGIDPFGLWTFQIGWSINFNPGLGVNVSFGGGFAVDGHGNFGTYNSVGSTLGFGGGSGGGLSVQGSNGDTICDLRGPFNQGSINGGDGFGGGVDFFNGAGSNGQYVSGGGFTFGSQVGSSGGFGQSKTVVSPF